MTGRVLLSLLLIAHLDILYMTDSRLIGLKLLGFVGSLFPFCLSFIIAVLKVVVSLPLIFISFTAAVIKGASTGQKVL